MNTPQLNILIFFFFIIVNQNGHCQVGINTTVPTEELDVDGDIRVRNLGNSTTTSEVFASPNGTLVTLATDNSVKGIRFVGFLDNDIDLDKNEEFFDINLSNELIDVLNEYDSTVGVYTPAVSGFYKISMDFDIGGYSNVSKDLDVVIGLWDITDNRWVLRRTYQHRNGDNSEFATPRPNGHGITNYLSLDSSHTYKFRILPTYDASILAADYDGILQKENFGGTGRSLSTSFSIEKAL